MSINELICESKKLYKHFRAEIDGLLPLLYFYSGDELVLLKKKIKMYCKYAEECKRIYFLLSCIYGEDDYDKLY